MITAQGRSTWESIVWHAPGFIIGLYFLSLQFVATINLSYLILLAGAIFLSIAQPVLAWRSLLTIPAALALALVLSTILSVAWSGSSGVNSLLPVSLIPGLLIYLIVVLCVRSAQQLAFVAIALLVSLCVVAGTFLAASFNSGFSRSVQLVYFRSHPLFLAANDVLMYVVFLPLVVWWMRRWAGRPGVLLARAYVLVLAALAVLLLSRLSLLIVAMCCLTYLGIAQLRRLWYLLAIIAVLGAVALLFDTSLVEKLRTLDLARLRTWIVATAMFADAPWFGNGPGSFSVLYPAYLSDMPETIRFGRESRDIGWAHSLFFEAAAERGAIGLAIVVACFWYMFSALRRRLRAGADDFVQALLLVVVVCFIAACFELSLLRVWGVFTLYLLLALVAVFAAPPHER